MPDGLPSASDFLSNARGPGGHEEGAAPRRAGVGEAGQRGSAVATVPAIEPDGTFVKVHPEDHPLPRACEVTVNFQDYFRSSSKLGRFGKVVGIDVEGDEYLIMLDDFECLAVPMRRVEWRKLAT